MAYRRKQTSFKPSAFDPPSAAPSPPPVVVAEAVDEEPAPSLAAQAIRASAAHRDSSLSSAYGDSAVSSSASGYRQPDRPQTVSSPSRWPRESTTYEYTSMKSLNESKYGFWGALARKAKQFIDDDFNSPKQFETTGIDRSQVESTSTGTQSYRSPQESYRKKENPPFQKKSSETITSSLNYIGGTIKNAFEEGKTIVESKTADIIQETRKLNNRRKGGLSQQQNEPGPNQNQKWAQQPNLPRTHTDYETQLKASRDVANAMAAKAKLLLRELKTVKADLAFAKERCAQLEEENKILRDSHESGGSPEDDDLIRLQLETLLAEKARLAHENSVYARENRFLREIVEYHQLTMQDVIYVDEGIEEVSEVYPTQVLPQVTASSASPKPKSVVTTPSPSFTSSNSSSSLSPFVVPEACPIVPTTPKPTF